MRDDLVSPLRVVSIRDEAIDWAAMWDRAHVSPKLYAETRDADSVRELPGRTARWYTLRPLSVADMGAIDSAASGPAQLVQAFRVAVTEIVGFSGPGTALRPTLPCPMPDGTTRMIWADVELQYIADVAGGMRLIYEIGAIARERALEGNALRGGVIYAPPQFLVPVLEQKTRPLVERQTTTDGTRSNAKPESSSTKMSESSSGEATDASAANGRTAPGDTAPPTPASTSPNARSRRSKKSRARAS